MRFDPRALAADLLKSPPNIEKPEGRDSTSPGIQPGKDQAQPARHPGRTHTNAGRFASHARLFGGPAQSRPLPPRKTAPEASLRGEAALWKKHRWAYVRARALRGTRSCTDYLRRVTPSQWFFGENPRIISRLPSQPFATMAPILRAECLRTRKLSARGVVFPNQTLGQSRTA